MTELLASFGFASLTILIYMCLWFCIGYFSKNNGLIDIGWGLGFVVISCALLVVEADLRNTFKLFYAFCVGLWGLRLAIFLGIRNIGKAEDFRYANWRKEWGKWVHLRAFFQVYMLQGILMLIIALPIIYVLSRASQPEELNWLFIAIGAILFFIGWGVESLADAQKSKFKQNPSNKGKFIQSGLWAYSRHPNYFGEILVWWGLWIMAFDMSLEFLITIISPVIITFLLLKVSGIPMLEAKYKGNAAYDAYKRITSPLIPLPKRKD